MRTCFKSVIRRPLQHVLLVLFLGVVSFGFVTHVAEYLAVTQAVDELSGYYKAIGYLNSGDGDVAEGARFLQDCDLVAINDVQRACSGTLQDIYNSDIDGNSNASASGYRNSEFFVLGELIEKEHHVPRAALNGDRERYTLRIHVLEYVYGYPDYVSAGDDISVSYYPDYSDENDFALEAAFDALRPDTAYAVKAYYSGSTTFSLRQAIPGGDWFFPAADDSKIAEVVEADAAQEINRHRLYIDGTKDMSSLLFTQESSHDGYLIDGRWLTAADDETQNPVCVILEGFAQTRGLSVGDSLTISLRDEPELVWGYYPEGTIVDEMDFADDPTITFTIVGIYNRIRFTQELVRISSHGQTVYVPNSCIPADYGDSWNKFKFVYEIGYSFVLDSPDSQDTFLQQYRKPLEDMGCTVHFVENGWAAFSTSAKSLVRSTLYGTVMFAVMHLLTLLLAAVFYFKLHQKEFSIARALGVSSARAIRWHLFPIMLLGVGSIAVGGILGWYHAMGQIQVTLSSLIQEGQEVSAQLSVGIPALLCLISWGILVLVAFVCYAALSRHAVMDILCEARKNQVSGRNPELSAESVSKGATGTSVLSKESVSVEASGVPVSSPESASAEAAGTLTPLKDKGGVQTKVSALTPPDKSGSSYLARFTWRHISRSKGRTVLTLIAAVIFVLALGWIQRSIDWAEQSIIDAYEGISVETEIVKDDSGNFSERPGFISASVVDSIFSTGFVNESELVATDMDAKLMTPEPDVTKIMSSFILCGITDATHLNQETRGVSVSDGNTDQLGEITYQDGWDASLFETDYDPETSPCPIIIPETVQEHQGIFYGDELSLVIDSQEMTVVVRGSYTGRFNGMGDFPVNRSVVLMPHSSMRELYGERQLYYSIARFVLEPTMNRELDTFRTAAEQILEKDTRSLLTTKLIIWDEELRMAIEPMEKNLILMRIFYPIAQIAVILGTGIITLLSLMQKNKIAFLLHVLGIPLRTVQFVLGGEQVLLGMIGSVGAVLVIIVSGSFSIRTVPCVVAYLVGLIIGTAAGCILLAQNQKQPGKNSG